MMMTILKYKEFYSDPSESRGFTLIELIIVIIVLGVLGTMGANFISQAFKGFAASDARMDIYEEGKTALERMEREIRNAIPNAVNLPAASDLQLGIIDEVAMHCSTPPCNTGQYVFGQYTENNPAGMNFIEDQSLALPAGSVLSIYNRNWNDLSNVAPAVQRVYTVTSAAVVVRMNLDRNINAASPFKRFYAVDKAVRYYLDGTTLKRSTAAINPGVAISFPINALGKPLAKNVSGFNFSYLPGSLERNALVSIEFTISKGGESVNFHKEIAIRNVP